MSPHGLTSSSLTYDEVLNTLRKVWTALFAFSATSGFVESAAMCIRPYIHSGFRSSFASGWQLPAISTTCPLVTNALNLPSPDCNANRRIAASPSAWPASRIVSLLTSSLRSISRNSRRTRSSSLFIQRSGT
jgi:hypothetical protein